MAGISIVPDPEYRGDGISEGLARGLLVWSGGENLTGEGMGIGSVAIRCPGYTCFSRTCRDSPGGEGVVVRTFLVDTRMSWSIFGTVSPWLTRSIEVGIEAYMRIPGLQRLLMAPVVPLRSLLRIHPVFESIPPTAEVTFTYRIAGTAVDISARVRPLAGPVGTVCLLNELSADSFAAGWIGGIIPPPPGWEELTGEMNAVSLYDPVHDIRFSIAAVSTSPPCQPKVFWGREVGEDLCWAGFAIEVGSLDGMEVPDEVCYRIEFTVGGST
ncbi:hypothetical protein [Methanosphaerula subterraneus]|uniref:hypothetical protein n=1 Tax=Methanosphaerula subterraneus TaxID=3350244 RepID=UPI003F83B7DD